MSNFYLSTYSVAVGAAIPAESMDRSGDLRFVKEAKLVLKVDSLEMVIKWSEGRPQFYLIIDNLENLINADDSEKLEVVLRHAMMYQFLERRAKTLKEFVNSEVSKYKSVANEFDSLF